MAQTGSNVHENATQCYNLAYWRHGEHDGQHSQPRCAASARPRWSTTTLWISPRPLPTVWSAYMCTCRSCPVWVMY